MRSILVALTLVSSLVVGCEKEEVEQEGHEAPMVESQIDDSVAAPTEAPAPTPAPAAEAPAPAAAAPEGTAPAPTTGTSAPTPAAQPTPTAGQ